MQHTFHLMISAWYFYTLLFDLTSQQQWFSKQTETSYFLLANASLSIDEIIHNYYCLASSYIISTDVSALEIDILEQS
jgi:hypothetical protein